MRSARSEYIMLAMLLAVPLAIVFLGWPAFVRWAAGPSPQATPTEAAAGAAATSVVGAATDRPTPRATAGAPATVVPADVTTQPAPTLRPTGVPPTEAAAAAAQPTSTPVAAAAPHATSTSAAAAAADPGAAVQDFYARVGQHDFGGAAALWSPQMRASYPPSQNIDARFSQTRAVTVNRAQVVSVDPAGSRATVAVDLTESAADGQHHWSGAWQLVRGSNGWLLDQPSLQPG